MNEMAIPYYELDHIKKDWYEKGPDDVNIHLYVRDVEEHDIIFEEKSVSVKFSTKHVAFLKLHAKGQRKKCSFTYVLKTRGDIDPGRCHFKLKAPFIELLLKKKVPVKWGSLERFDPDDLNESPKKEGKKKKQTNSPKNSPTKHSQLLGGKSTPLTKEGGQDGPTKVENQASSSTMEDKKNIKKATTTTTATSQSESPLVGLTGLENYSNNCYMNVVIQILANIQETRDFFKNDHFLKEINSNNPLSSGGKVAKAFAEVIKALWSNRRHAIKPTALKSIMGKRCSLFLGWQQHDAQEFFASLLDNLHEDLNQYCYEKSSEKEKETCKQDGESCVNEKPDTAWSAHLKRNNSFIIKLFHGQLMSKLTCASCRKVSYSYDPCAQVSLPIPSNTNVLSVLLYTRDTCTPPSLITVPISTPNAQVWHLVNLLQAATKIPSHLVALFEGYSDVCSDDRASLTSFQKQKYVVASEVSSKEESDVVSIPVFQYLLNRSAIVCCHLCGKLQNELQTSKLKRCTRCMAVAYCSHDCQTKDWSCHSRVCTKDLKMQVGLPFYIVLRKDSISYEAFEELLRERASFSVECCLSTPAEEDDNRKKDENTSSANGGSDESENKQKMVNSVANCQFVIKMSSKTNVNDEACALLNQENFSIDVIAKTTSIIMEWQNTPVEEGAATADIRSKEVPTYKVIENASTPAVDEQCTLYDCLRLFLEPERLDETESWKCSKCKSLQAAKKEMAISSPPCLLLLHLKRFTYGQYGQKINKSVSYPLSNLDLSPFIAKETRNKIDYLPTYDLCGVITHRGTMRMGHYTCMVRLLNQSDQDEVGWRLFDDDYAIKIKNEKVVSPDAYVLVYRLRGAQDVIKIDRYPLVTNTSPASSMENMASTVKRKRADSVAGSGKSPGVERRSVSESTLNRIRRSTSVESAEEVGKKEGENALPTELRRCASALPIETNKSESHGTRKGLFSSSLPDVTTNENDAQKVARLKHISSSSDEYANALENLNNDNALCDSFEKLTVDADLEKNLGYNSCVDSEQFLECDNAFQVDEENVEQKSAEDINENDLD